MNGKTKTILIVVCVIGFVLTSTFTWGVIESGIVVTKAVADQGIDVGVAGVNKTREATAWSVAWILAHANALVPVAFLGFIVWLVMQKPKEQTKE